MRFSVLMPVYHKESADNFDLALNSILKSQKRPPDEFVLVCDGALTPELDAVVEQYSSAYPDILKVYRLEENVGLGQALNYGLTKCTYEYIARADSDDICLPERFEKQMGFFEAHPDIAVLGSDIDEFNIDPSTPERRKTMPATHEKIVAMGKFRNPINHMTVAFKKEAVLQAGSYQHLPYAEDYYLWVRMFVEGFQFANLNEVLVHARVGNGMIGRRGNRQYITSWKILCKYMHAHGLLSAFEHLRNMVSVRVFVYVPPSLKTFIYKKVLRRKE